MTRPLIPHLPAREILRAVGEAVALVLFLAAAVFWGVVAGGVGS